MKLATATAIIVMLGVAPALADTGQRRAMPMMPSLEFEAADADGDGSITREEWGSYIEDQMQTRRAAMFERRAAQMIEAGDSDGDGLLSQDELASVLEERHMNLRERMAERHEQRMEQRSERRAERGERGDRPRHGRAHGRRAMAPGDFAERSFQRLDANSDGVISPEEFAAAMERWEDRAGRRRAGQSD
ncbi:MAG: EF-hand domain-containing protein [Pararhodobacter sp.]|nr:EF-hand domain-containing protein [Pararhodobacter sp.]